MKEIKYLNFPVSFLRKRDLEAVLEQALQFCLFESMVLNNGDRSYFDTLSVRLGLSGAEFDLFVHSKKLYEENVKSVRCGVSLEVFINYLRTSKDELNLEFRAYSATKAVIGNKAYKKTRYREVFSMMFGYTKYEDISEKTKLELSKIEDSRYMKRLLEKLEQKWHLSIYSLNSRGLYISYKLAPVELIVEVKKSKIIAKKKQVINEKKADKILENYINNIESKSDS